MQDVPTFNADQSAAIAHVEGPCVVLAGPGAGKTAVLTHRAAELVRAGAAPERVLLLTFTKASSRQMMSRAAAIEPACERLAGGTFHALATRLVNRNAHVFGADRPFTVIDPQDCTEIVKKVMDPLRKGDENWPPAKSVHKVISYAANTRLPMEEVVAKLCREHASLVESFIEVRDAYITYKQSKRLLDYDDALEYMGALLEDPELGPQIRSQWDFVMIDEYQDTNALQLDIVYGLAGENGNVMVVGDPSQSIFGFRGSAPATMAAFRDRFERCRVIDLHTNYRSNSEIVDLVNVVDRRLNTGFDRTLTSAVGPSGERPSMIEVQDEIAQAKAIADAVLEHKEQGGEISECAVLVRAMSFARIIEGEFTSRRIPYKVVGGLKIDEAAHVKDLLSFARLATNTRHEPAWLRVLKRYKGVGDVAASAIAERVMSCEDHEEILDVLAEEEENRDLDFVGLVPGLRAMMQPDRDPDISLAETIRIMEPFWSTVKEWREDWQERRRDFEAIQIVAAQYRSIEGFLTAITLDRSIDQKKTSDMERQDEAPVTISTIHGAKGLEWNCVHIPSLIRGHMPAGFADDPDEEMRLLYVALSRAKRELSVYRPQFNRKDEYAAASDFETMLRPRMTAKRIAKKVSDGGSLQTGRRIDMSKRMLGRR